MAQRRAVAWRWYRHQVLAGYDFVAFDFDGTLVDFVSADALALEAVRQQHAPLVDAQKFRQAAIEEIIHFHEEVALGTAVGADMHRTRLERTLKRFCLSTPNPVDRYRAHLIDASVPMAGADELLGQLRARGVPVAIVSNAYDADEQRARIKRAFPHIDFAAIVIGSECAAPKPDRAPFDRLVDLLGRQPEHGIYIGDIPAYDIPGAAATGLATLIVTNLRDRARTAADAGAQVVHELSALLVR